MTRMVLSMKENGKMIKKMVKVTENVFLVNFGEENPFFIFFFFFFWFWGIIYDYDIYEGDWKNDKKDGYGDRKYFSCLF